MKKIILITLLLITPALISACNTVRGMGEDISGAADATKKAIGR